MSQQYKKKLKYSTRTVHQDTTPPKNSNDMNETKRNEIVSPFCFIMAGRFGMRKKLQKKHDIYKCVGRLPTQPKTPTIAATTSLDRLPQCIPSLLVQVRLSKSIPYISYHTNATRTTQKANPKNKNHHPRCFPSVVVSYYIILHT